MMPEINPITVNQIEEYRRFMLPVLNFRAPVLTHGQGLHVWDTDGRNYLDLNSGQFCSVFGHSDEGVKGLMQKICSTLQDTDTSTLSVQILVAAKAIHEIAKEMNPRVLFLSTGAEAVECCLRYAKHIKEKPGIVSFDRAYHGQTHGSAAYSMSRTKIRPTLDYSYSVPTPEWFSPASPDDSIIEPYVDAFEKVIRENRNDIAAAIFEPIVSGGGFYFPPDNYFKEIRRLCDKYEIFLIFDECQTGMGRTGYWFQYQKSEVIPDFVIAAKAIGLGFPVSCVIANGNTVDQKQFIMEHFSSHQNEPFSGEIVNFLIEEIKINNMLKENQYKGEFLLSLLQQLAENFNILQNPRGIGLMCAFDLNLPGDTKESGSEFCRRGLDFGLMLQHCNLGKTIRLLPNYKTSKSDFSEFSDRLEALLKSY